MKRPSFQFYPSDWRKDPALSACSIGARGLWIELLCIAHEADQYGHLSINGKPMSTAQIARMVGETPAIVARLMAELDAAGVFSKTDDGAIYSRRMVKDEHIRNVRASAGRIGGNPNLVRSDNRISGDEGSDLLKQKDKQMDKQSPTPSSSSSSSIPTNPDGLVVDGQPPTSAMPPCPHGRLIELFGQRLPELPQPRPELWDGKKADAMRSRWRWVLSAKTKAGKRYAEDADEAIGWFDRFFGYVAKCPHLVGHNDRGWTADLGWLMKADNFAKVIQGNYEPQREAA